MHLWSNNAFFLTTAQADLAGFKNFNIPEDAGPKMNVARPGAPPGAIYIYIYIYNIKYIHTVKFVPLSPSDVGPKVNAARPGAPPSAILYYIYIYIYIL